MLLGELFPGTGVLIRFQYCIVRDALTPHSFPPMGSIPEGRVPLRKLEGISVGGPGPVVPDGGAVGEAAGVPLVAQPAAYLADERTLDLSVEVERGRHDCEALLSEGRFERMLRFMTGEQQQMEQGGGGTAGDTK